MTVNWRDIQATIQQTTISVKKTTNPVGEDSESEGKNSEMNTPSDPEDPLKWLDDSLPDLSGYNRQEFDLALQFDIRRYVDILADSVSDPRKTLDSRETATQMPHTKLKETAANTLAPADEEWGKW
jgi:hypothetical protein